MNNIVITVNWGLDDSFSYPICLSVHTKMWYQNMFDYWYNASYLILSLKLDKFEKADVWLSCDLHSSKTVELIAMFEHFV